MMFRLIEAAAGLRSGGDLDLGQTALGVILASSRRTPLRNVGLFVI
jgi:hypothetical protein